MDLLFIDTETTHLETGKGEIVEFALIVDTQHKRNFETISYRIKPDHIESASKKALEINGYTEHGWRGAKSAEIAVHDMYLRLCVKNTIIVGHNVGFDLKHLNYLFNRYGYKSIGYRTIDTKALALEHLPFLKSYSMDTLRSFFGLSKIGSHRALKDTLDCRILYYILIRASTQKRLYWRLNWMVRKWIKKCLAGG
jgi:ATP-dependent DNA helicase DinG